MKLIDQIHLLPDEEKLMLVNQILESISEEKKYAVPKNIVQLVQERVERYHKNPSSALSLDEFKSQLKERLDLRK